mmetsp:Transcript_741/g.1794  ORF Transcript_741/g.1794 Transcript_741/m.1794 type:complete len:156 (+) Transcript_741:185-652(+)
MNDDTETTITLTSKPQEDGTTRSFQIPYAAAQISGTIMDAVGGDDDSDDDDGGEREETVVPLEQIDAACLEKIVKFLIHFKDEKMREIPATSFGGLAPQPFDRVSFVQFTKYEVLFFNNICHTKRSWLNRQRHNVLFISTSTFANFYASAFNAAK